MERDYSPTTHPKPKQEGKHREFSNLKTGKKVRFDKGNPNEPGHRGEDHFHRYNPNSKIIMTDI